MADILQIGTFNAGGRFTPEFDLNSDANGVKVIRDTLSVSPPADNAVSARAYRRFGGSRRVAELHDNGAVSADFYLQGTTPDATLAKFDSLTNLVEDTTTQRHLKWRPDGASHPVYFEIRGTSWTPKYRWIEFSTTRTLQVSLGFDVAPLALGDPLDIYDDFSTDTLGLLDYTFDSSAISDVAISGGAMVATANPTVRKRLYHTGRGYQFADSQVTIKYTTPSTGMGDFEMEPMLKFIGNNNYLAGYVSNSYGLSVRRNNAWIGPTASPSLAASTTYWIRARIEGNIVTVEHWTTEPTPSGTPAASVSYTLATTDAAGWGAGVKGYPGISFKAGDVSARIEDFRVEPYTYRQHAQPETFTLDDIPGTAPAQVDVDLGVIAASAVQIWGLLGWSKKVRTFNHIWNGNFDWATLGTEGWVVNGGYVNAGVSTLSRVTTAKKFGAASMQIVTPATQYAGAQFDIYRPFKKGVTYTFEYWVYAPSSTSVIQSFLGSGGDLSTVSQPTLSTTWTRIVHTWTPAADVYIASAVVRNNAAVAATFMIDGVQVYEGTVAPTTGNHALGAGAPAPFGLFNAANTSSMFMAGMTLNPSVVWWGGYGLYNGGAAATTSSIQWIVDPSLLVPDDFTGEIAVEVYANLWLRTDMGVLTATLRALPMETVTEQGTIYTVEHGTAGKTVVAVSGSNAQRPVKLGTLVFPITGNGDSRYRIVLSQVSTLASNHGIGSFYFVPARQRAAGPTGKVNNSAYPALFSSTTLEEVKRIKSDLSGFYSTPAVSPFTRATGLGGQIIEVDPGDAQFFIRTSNLIPDDPTVANSTTDTTNPSPPLSAHFAVQPRYHLTRTD